MLTAQYQFNQTPDSGTGDTNDPSPSPRSTAELWTALGTAIIFTLVCIAILVLQTEARHWFERPRTLQEWLYGLRGLGLGMLLLSPFLMMVGYALGAIGYQLVRALIGRLTHPR